MRYLVFSTDILPLDGHSTSGIVLRTQGIIDGLRENGHEVFASCPSNVVSNIVGNPKYKDIDQNQLEKLKIYSFNYYNQLDIIYKVNPDVLIFGHWPAVMIKKKLDIPIIIDLAGPHLLERLYQGEKNHVEVTHSKIHALAKADYFLVSGPSQKEYFKPYIQRAGHKNFEKKFIDIPMPIFSEKSSNKTPRQASNKDSNAFPRIFFGGVFLPWQNPKWSLESVVKILNKFKKGKLVLVGGPHPNYKINTHSYKELFSNLKNEERVEVHGLLPYDQFLSKMSSCDLAINLMEWNFERQLAVPIRSTSYLDSGLPLIIDNYSDIGEIVTAYDAGWSVAYGDYEKLENVLTEVFNNPEILVKKSANSLKLSKEIFNTKDLTNQIANKVDDFYNNEVYEESSDINLDFVDSSNFKLDNCSEENPLRQYFICKNKGLHKVQFRVSTEHIGDRTEKLIAEIGCLGNFNKNHLKLKYLRDSSNVKVIAKEEFEVADNSDSSWQSISFNSIPESMGKSYYLSVYSSSAKPIKTTLFGVLWNGLPLLPLDGSKESRGKSICLRVQATTNRGGPR